MIPPWSLKQDKKHEKWWIQLFLIPFTVRQHAESFVSSSLFLSVVRMVTVTLTSGRDVIRYKKPTSLDVIVSIFFKGEDIILSVQLRISLMHVVKINVQPNQTAHAAFVHKSTAVRYVLNQEWTKCTGFSSPCPYKAKMEILRAMFGLELSAEDQCVLKSSYCKLTLTSETKNLQWFFF